VCFSLLKIPKPKSPIHSYNSIPYACRGFWGTRSNNCIEFSLFPIPTPHEQPDKPRYCPVDEEPDYSGHELVIDSDELLESKYEWKVKSDRPSTSASNFVISVGTTSRIILTDTVLVLFWKCEPHFLSRTMLFGRYKIARSRRFLLICKTVRVGLSGAYFNKSSLEEGSYILSGWPSERHQPVKA
jgi:hypothetical protein